MDTDLETDCVIVGGGPAGLMMALLLLREGVAVTVVEKHPDFLRDFRGDTIHPSTQDILADVGLLEEFLARPHADTVRVTLAWHGDEFTLADFSRLPVRRRMLTFMPQWDFLDLLASACEQYPSFRLLRSTEVSDVTRESGRVVGVVAAGPEGEVRVRGRLVVAADGRDSTVRKASGLSPTGSAAAMDVLWFRLPKSDDRGYPFIQAGAGMIVTIDRADYLQVAHVIPAGSWTGSDDDLVRMRERISVISPRMGRLVEVLEPADVHLLRVRIERLRRWYVEGMLCIGDAAHAMSPVGGVGINLAIQDAVAAARILGPALRDGHPNPSDLRRVQRRRALPTRITQAVQRRLQGPLLAMRDAGDRGTRLPFPLRMLRRYPVLTHLTGRFVGLGVRRESVPTS